jgi:hypothetical protein
MVFAQHPQHPPLLVAQAMAAQTWAGVGHHQFACLQQQTRQVAMDEGLAHGVWKAAWNLFNILND